MSQLSQETIPSCVNNTIDREAKAVASPQGQCRKTIVEVATYRDDTARAFVGAAGNPKTYITPKQSLHVLEIITAARESNRTGRHVDIKSTFNWPLIEA